MAAIDLEQSEGLSERAVRWALFACSLVSVVTTASGPCSAAPCSPP
jgi:hypothetical protein